MGGQGVAGGIEALQGREGGAAHAGLRHAATPDRDAVGVGDVARAAALDAGADGSAPPQHPKIRTIFGPAPLKEPHRPPFALVGVGTAAVPPADEEGVSQCVIC